VSIRDFFQKPLKNPTDPKPYITFDEKTKNDATVTYSMSFFGLTSLKTWAGSEKGWLSTGLHITNTIVVENM